MPQTYDPERLHLVRLTRQVRVAGVMLRPIAAVEMTGATLNALIEEHGADAVDSAVPC